MEGNGAVIEVSRDGSSDTVRRDEQSDQYGCTYRSLEGLGYLGMLSATPTDMAASVPRAAE
ncbi:hypothetical protein ANK1_4100 [plant metagenome]|uniref:Uncharacterized protein n=1 Tax=plant metagenome TaxID=1297885 RepID=A0A484Q0Y1_9ZZZZ